MFIDMILPKKEICLCVASHSSIEFCNFAFIKTKYPLRDHIEYFVSHFFCLYQVPIYEQRNDGRDNLLGALVIAGHYVIPEVGGLFILVRK